MNSAEAKTSFFADTVKSIASSIGVPLLYGPDDKPLRPSSAYTYRRDAAKRTGSLKNWIPQRLWGRQAVALEREKIVERSVDITNNDPHACGIVDTVAATVVGSGLVPHPSLNADILGIDKEAAREIQKKQVAAYQLWYPYADAGARMSFGAIQYLVKRNIMQYGEYLVLLHMIKDPIRPYSLACRVINPMRLKTPTDKTNDPNIIDGVEIGKFGAPVAYWIKKTGTGILDSNLPDTSKNFLRITARKAHRWKVLHGFFCQSPEQVRGMPFFAPALKYLRDLNDYLDAELVSNIVTAAFSLFIETGDANPYDMADFMASRTETRTNADNESEDTRYQELIPGGIMYGQTGQKPHPIAANRPGATFDPFVKVIKKAIASSFNIPYPVLFKDVENVNFAGFRSAMLDAWRVYMYYRTWLGQGFNQPIYDMLQEEAYLRGDLPPGTEFYKNMRHISRCDWRGSPKGDIEPVKAVTADVKAIEAKIKTRAEAITERGGDYQTTMDQIEEEENDLEERGLGIEKDPDKVKNDGIAQAVVDKIEENKTED
jgi:lambda family phage portal protein